MNNRLQFRQHGNGSGYTIADGVFATRDEAIEYIQRGVKYAEEGLASIDVSYGLSLFGEPTVLRYKNEENEEDPHLMLVIGSMTNTDGRHIKNRFCIIDIDKTESEIGFLQEEIDRLSHLFTLVVKESDTLALHTTIDEEGSTIISGDVKVAESHVFNRIARDNAIIETEDGIFTFVGLEYDDATSTFKFTVNGDTNTFVVGGDNITGGTYSTEDESLHLISKSGEEVVVDLEELIDEWTVEGEAAKSPIVLTRKEVGYGDDVDHSHVEPWQDILSADVRIADDRNNNILKKTNDNRYLYVDGVASNIAYYSSSGKTNVQAALEDLSKVRVSTDSNNILTTKLDGFFASTKLEYISNENTLVFTTSTNDEEERRKETRIKLNSFSVFENIVYDPTKETLIITYIDGNGETKFLSIPIGELLTNWEIDVISEGHSVQLQKTRNIQGTDLISADVKIFNGSDNILQDYNHMLYVKGTSENIKYGDNSTVKAEIDALKVSDANLDNKINLEIVRAQSKEGDLNDKIDLEATRATDEEAKLSSTIGSGFSTDLHETVTYKFNELSEQVSSEGEALQAEIERSTAKDAEHDGKIEAIEDEIGDGFGPRNTVADAIANEAAQREAADQALQDAIAAISGDTSGKVKEIINNDHSITVDSSDETKPVISVKLSEQLVEGKDNIIKLNADGIYAGVDLSYEETANKLIFKTTNGSKEIQLESMSSIISMEYNPIKEAIVITYMTNGHEIKTLEIPVGDLINEWRVDESHDGAIQLEKIRIPSGTTDQDILKASVVISNGHDDNILVNDNGALYVSGKDIADNTTAIEALQGRMDSAETDINTVQTSLSDETLRATNAENDIASNLADEATARLSADTELRNYVDSAITGEKTARESADAALTTAINNEATARETGDATLASNLANAISTEKTARENADATLQTALDGEITRSTAIDSDHEARIAANTTAISSEVTRALSAETELRTSASTIVNALESLGDTVGAAVERLEAKDAELEDKIDEIDNEYLIDFDNTNTVTFVKTSASKGYVIEASVNVDDSNDNNIKETANGIYSKVDLTYDGTTNKLTFVNTNGSKEIALVSNSIIDKIYYQPSDETIVIEYTINGVRQPDVVVPVRDLIDEIDVEDTETVELIKTENQSTGADVITANVKINSYHDDNILVNDGGLYVSGAQIETNKADIATLNSGLADEVSRATSVEDALNTRITNNTNSIASETLRAASAETTINNAIIAETNRATAEEARLDSRITSEIANVTSSIANEVTRAANAEQALDSKIGIEVSSAKTELGNQISAETNRATSAETRLDTKIDSTKSVLEAEITAETNRATSAETRLDNKITSEVANTKTVLETEITAEGTRAVAEETRIEGKVDSEISRATSAEEALSDRIDAVDAKTFTLTVEDTTTLDLTYEDNKLSGNIVLANGAGNIIKSTSDSVDGSGLYASVDMEYNPATNKLKLITSAMEKEFSLSVGSILKSIEYDSVGKNLVIKYDVNIGGVIHEEQVSVPVEDLFNDWTVQEGQHLGAIILHKEEGVSGNPDVLSAEIVLSTLSDNMLINDQGALYVSRRPIDDLSGEVMTLREELEASLGTEDTLTLHLERDASKTLKGDVKISSRDGNLIQKDNTNGGIIFDGNIDCGTY